MKNNYCKLLTALLLLLLHATAYAACPPGDGTTNAQGYLILYFGASADFPSPTGPLGSATNPLTDWNSSNGGMDAINDCFGNVEMRFVSCYFNTDGGFGDINYTDRLVNASIDNVILDGQGAFMENLAASASFLRVAARDNWTIKNFTFSGWNANALLLTDMTNTVIENCIFDSNPTQRAVRVDTEDGSSTGGSDVTFNSCVFSNNPPVSETPSTGAVEVREDEFPAGNADNLVVTFNDCDFSCNARQGFGGGALWISPTSFPSNAGPTVNINGGSFANNFSGTDTGDGGAIGINGESSFLTIDGTLFSCNYSEASTGDGGGGAIRIQAGPTVSIDNSTFYGNYCTNSAGSIAAGGYGGAININSTSNVSTLSVSNSSFVENQASRGGAFYLESGNVTFDNVLVTNNTAVTDNGGGVNNAGANFSIINTSITANAPDDIAGAVTDNGGTATVTDPGITACAGCAPVQVAPTGCEADPGVLDISDCVLLCSEPDGGGGGSTVATAGQAFDLTLTFTPPTCGAPTDFTYVWLITDAAGDILTVVPAADADTNGIPDAAEGTPESFDFNALGLAAGDYNIYGYHYETATGSDPAPGTNISALDTDAGGTNTAACDAVSTASPTVTVLNPVTATVVNSCPGAASGTFTSQLVITGGLPEFNGGGTYTFTNPGGEFTSPYTFGTPQTNNNVTFVSTATNVEVQVTDDGNGASAGGCITCVSENTAVAQVECVICPVVNAVTGATTLCSDETSDYSVSATDLEPGQQLQLVQFDDSQTDPYTAAGGTILATGATPLTAPGVSFPVMTTVQDYYIYGIITPTPTEATCQTFTELIVTVNPATPTAVVLATTSTCADGTGQAAGDETVTLADLVTSGDMSGTWTVTTGGGTIAAGVYDPGAGGTVGATHTLTYTIAGTGPAATECADRSYTTDVTFTNCATAPVLQIVKANSPTGTVEVGDVITYTLTVTNTATGATADDATNVLISDAAPANTTFVAGSTMYVSGIAPVMNSPATPNWTVATLQPGESTAVSFQVTVDAATPAGTVIPNTATTQSDELPDPIPSNEVENTVIAPVLEIVKANSPTGNVKIGDVITYTLTVTNTATGAGAGSATNVLIDDAAPANTTFVTASTAYVSGVMPIMNSPATPNWTIAALAPGESTTVSFQVTVNDGTPAGTVIPNIATTQSDEIPDPIDSNEVENTVVAPVLEIVKANDPTGNVKIGDVITYTLTVTNTATGAGAGSAENVLITDAAPANTTLVANSTAYVSGVMPVMNSPATPNWTIAELQPGESTTVSFQVTVNDGTPEGTTILNVATTQSDEDPDPVPSNEVENPVVAPLLEIVKANNPTDIVKIGDVITYTLTVTNTGTGSAENVLIDDMAPANTTFVAASTAYVSGVNPVNANPATPNWTIAELQPNESTTVSFQVTVDDGTPAGTVIPNVATTQSDEIPDPINSNEVDNTVVAPILEIVKANSPTGNVKIGDVITYTLTVTNAATGAGAGSAENVLITDAAPANTTLVANSTAYVSGVMPIMNSPATPNWTIATLQPGESTTVSFQVTVNDGTPEGTTILNVATTQSDEDPDPVPSNEVENPVVAPLLEIVKANNPTDIVKIGDVITYTLTVTNTGTGSAENVLIDDMAPANTTFVAASTAYVSGVNPVNANPATPNWTIAELQPNESTTVSFQVTVNDGTPAGTVIPNIATTQSDEIPDPIDSNEVDNTVVAPILEIVKANSPTGNVKIGDVITYTLTVTNTATGAGAGSAENVLITDAAPANTTLVANSTAYVSGVMPVMNSPATPNWTIAELQPGESTTVSFQVTVNDGTPAGTVILNTATTISDEIPDPIISNEVNNNVVAPLLTITKANDPTDIVKEGETITYTLTVTNTSAGATAGSATNVLVNDTAPANTTFVNGSTMYVSGVAPVNSNPTTPSWTIPELQPGESTTVSFQVTVNDGTPAGTIIPNTATTNSDELPDPIPSNEVENTVVAPILEIVKANDPTGIVQIGDEITYTLTVTNTATGAGAGSAVNVLIDDAAPANTTLVPGSTMFVGGIAPTTGSPATPNWTVAELQPGQSTTVSFTVTVDAGTPASTVILNTATTQSDEDPDPIDSNEVENTVGEPILTLTKSNAPAGTICVGSEIIYTLTVSNIGDGNATQVVIDDAAPANTTLVPGSTMYVSGVMPNNANPATPNWMIATLQPGESTTVSFAVTVDVTTADGTEILNTATTGAEEIPDPVPSNEVINTVTVPTLTCRQPISTTTAADECGNSEIILLEPFYTSDNCGGEPTVTNDAPDMFEIGTTTVTHTVTYPNGFSQSCEQNVTVTDLTGPTVIYCNTSIDWAYDNCTAIVQIDVNASDACGIASIEGNGFFPMTVGIHPHPVTITDMNGNSVTHLITVYVHDQIQPEATSCPEDVTVSADALDGFVLPTATFIDNCEILSVTNDAPDEFPLGTTTVTWDAEDTYGLHGYCIFDVTVVPPLAIGGLQDIETCVEEADATAAVRWNAPRVSTLCAACPTTDFADFQYLGDFYGHQYFYFTGAEMAWEEAIETAQMLPGGNLVTVDNRAENNFLRYALPTDVNDLWLGLEVNEVEGIFEYTWADETESAFQNFGDVLNYSSEATVITLQNTGAWTFTNADEMRGFLVERPCVNVEQTGPILETITATGDTLQTLLTVGSAWPVGEYTASYRATDDCGNEVTETFAVSVDQPQAAYCATGGTDTDLRIAQISARGQRRESNNDAGYDDFTDNPFVFDVSQNSVRFEMIAGGNAAGQDLYWRMWTDKNHDGDFFDAGEMIWETVDNSEVFEAFIPLLQFSNTEQRMRVAVSRFDFPEVCADFYSGEAEDFTVSYTGTFELNIGAQTGESPAAGTELTEANVTLAPNPATDFTTVHFPLLTTDARLEVLDNTGRTVTAADVAAGTGSYRLPLKDLANGVYLLRLSNDRQAAVIKQLVVIR